MKRKKFLTLLGTAAVAGPVSLYGSSNHYNKQESYEFGGPPFLDSALGGVSKLLSPVLNSFIPGSGEILDSVGTVGNLIGEKGKTFEQILEIITKGLDAIGGLTKDYDKNFSELVSYHKSVQKKLDNIKVNNEVIIDGQIKIIRNQFLILDQLITNQQILLDELSQIERRLIDTIKSTSLDEKITIIDYMINESSQSGIKNWKEKNRDKYGESLLYLLTQEFRSKMILSFPNYVTIFIYNDRINGIKISESLKTLRNGMDVLLKNTEQFYINIDEIFNEKMKNVYYQGGVAGGRKWFNKVNILNITNFGTQAIDYEWNYNLIDRDDLIESKPYKTLEDGKKKLMAASQDRDSLKTTLKVVERFYWSLFA